MLLFSLLRRTRCPSTPAVSLLLMSFAVSAWATTYRVPDDYATLGEALAVADRGDTVLLAEGVHYETDWVWMNSGVRLIGDGTYETVELHFAGMVVRPPATGDSTGTIIENIHFESHGTWTPLLEVRGNPFTVMRYNRFYMDGSVRFEGGGTFERNLVIKPDISAPTRGLSVGGGPFGVPGELHVAYNEFVLSVGGFMIDPRGWVTACEFHHNTVVYPGWPGGLLSDMSGWDYGGGEFHISSNIFQGLDLFCSDYGELGGSIEFDHNCFYPYHEDLTFPCVIDDWATNIEADPLFCDFGSPEFWDWRLSPNSPCVGAGVNGTNIGALGVGCGPVGVGAAGAELSVLPIRLIPNPSSGPVNVSFTLPSRSDVAVRVFDTAGRVVSRPFEGLLPSGPHSLVWDARKWRLPSGVYFLRVSGPEVGATARLLLVQ